MHKFRYFLVFPCKFIPDTPPANRNGQGGDSEPSNAVQGCTCILLRSMHMLHMHSNFIRDYQPDILTAQVPLELLCDL